MKSKKVLVTSGAGFIGTYLVQELKGRGLKVFAADLSNAEHNSHIRAGVRNFRQLIFRLCRMKNHNYLQQI
jgi:nucleoside-diphosphate-sugar epimerase